MFPANLKHLVFGSRFNQPENVLPDRLTHLIFRAFNRPLSERLDLGSFNQPLRDRMLPDSLIHLTFGRCRRMCCPTV